MLADVCELLACPQCGDELDLLDRALVCTRGHSFDIARQGYVTLLTGSATKFTGDSPEMIAARSEFLDSGHFDPLMSAVADAVVLTATEAGCPDKPRLLEIGSGTGHYLVRALDGVPTAHGIGVDLSKPAARRLARAHPRAAAVVADVWRQLPVRDQALTHVLSVFAPRNVAEIDRVLADEGTLVILTPTDRHLVELVGRLGMVRVDERKVERLGETVAGRFERVRRTPVEIRMMLSHRDVENIVGMGPSARHLTPAKRAEAIAALPEPFPVTASVVVSTYRRVVSPD
ncbi:putative RNA methyltransferase [Rhodococcus spongiicola]|uniref:Methyltransferase domain-containing protein n=1 Tax=Rhodococcus spongiicola TaxID=2487352 RepID=A0A3S3AQL9_9NOCA|nr:methyltransferase domain-containing protein [Rhodococcus spongiicola]RVW06107.1 methyltransferase domain-containing protein [Rhodococcus spongiicola]